MSGLMDKAKDMIGNKENQAAQPGDKVEGKADGGVNNAINDGLNQVGLGQDSGAVDKAADAKVNDDIPGGSKF